MKNLTDRERAICECVAVARSLKVTWGDEERAAIVAIMDRAVEIAKDAISRGIMRLLDRECAVKKARKKARRR